MQKENIFIIAVAFTGFFATPVLPDDLSLLALTQECRECDFSRRDMKGVNFSSTTLTDVDFRNSSFVEANFSNSTIYSGELSSSEFKRADFNNSRVFLAITPIAGGSKVIQSDFTGANFDNANIIFTLEDTNISDATFVKSEIGINAIRVIGHSANFSQARRFEIRSGSFLLSAPENAGFNFIESDLRKADFSDASLEGSRFIKSNLNNANFSASDLSGAAFSNSDLQGADFSKARLGHAKLDNANLVRANFSDSYLFSADFSNSDLRGANFLNANIRAANLKGANLCEAIGPDGSMLFIGCD